jgi:hypothetical protein
MNVNIVIKTSVEDPDPGQIPTYVFGPLPDPDPFVKGTGPDPAPQPVSSSKNRKKNLDSYCFATSL